MQQQQQYQNGYLSNGAYEGYEQGGHYGHENYDGYENYDNNGSWQQEYAQAAAGPYQGDQQYQGHPAGGGRAQVNAGINGAPRQQNPQQGRGVAIGSPPQQYPPQTSYLAHEGEQSPGQAITYDDRSNAAPRQRQYPEQGDLRRPPPMQRRGTGQSAASSSPATSQRQHGMIGEL